jgi:preprotein translocase subunit YajC
LTVAAWQTVAQVGVVVLVLILGLLLLVRPQLKRMSEHQLLLDSLAIGDHVALRGGLIGTIKSFQKSDVVGLAITPDTIVLADKNSVERKLHSDFGQDFKDIFK